MLVEPGLWCASNAKYYSREYTFTCVCNDKCACEYVSVMIFTKSYITSDLPHDQGLIQDVSEGGGSEVIIFTFNSQFVLVMDKNFPGADTPPVPVWWTTHELALYVLLLRYIISSFIFTLPVWLTCTCSVSTQVYSYVHTWVYSHMLSELS